MKNGLDNQISSDSQYVKDWLEGLNRRVKEGLTEAGQRAVLPKVRVLSTSVSLPFITVKATSRRLFITTRGSKLGDRITGLLNFGGTVTTPIRPKDKQALTVAPGVIRAAVTGPRKYRGKHFMEKARDQSLPEVERIMMPS